MMQESVYSKLAVDGRMVDSLLTRLTENRPPEGLIQALQVTEKQFAAIKNIVGDGGEREEVETLDSLVVI